MNPHQQGRPPSYTHTTAAAGSLGQNAPPTARSASPLPPPGHGLGHSPASHAMNGPPPINTGAGGGYAPQGAMGGGMGAPPPAAGGPPQYGYGAPGGPPPGGVGQYGGRPNAVEVEGAGRSKAQLIVGIDFVGALNLGACMGAS